MTPSRTSTSLWNPVCIAVLAIAAAASSTAVFSQSPTAADQSGTTAEAPSAKPASPEAPPAVSTAPSSPEAARQARLVADTARLYKLAQELKVEVDKSSKDTMSVAVIKKAAEVEALARDLKERLKVESAKAK
ncbi:MAG TPA: hypothetical protein VGD64_07170 [Acidisarcina sp.]